MGDRKIGPVPNRWLYCPRKSDTLIAERFLAFKTPLSMDFKDQMPLDCIFTPEMIFGYIKTLKLKLGLWIDLTNTKRFYNRSIVESNGATYVKLQCRGHGETPSIEQTHAFIEFVDGFIAERPFDIIAVHCTHGFNRTGFLIVSYMVQRHDCSVEAALALFAKARPPGIYKQDYINELFRRYEGDEEESSLAPELPAWCLEYDDSNGNDSGHKRKYEETPHSSNAAPQKKKFRADDGTENGDDDSFIDDGDDDGDKTEENGDGSRSRRKKRRSEFVVKNATFMEGVPGVVLVTEQPRLGELQHMVQEMCKWPKNGFPGAQPVSMDRTNLKRLHEIPYRVSWKADGTRYMMLIHKRGEIYFFDRNNSCFQVEKLAFVRAGNLHEHLENTLLDGEMVLDKFQGATIPRYLIYDIVKFAGKDIGMQPFFPNRLECIRNEIIEPRHQAIRNGIIDRNAEPFSVRGKDFWDIWQSVSLMGEKFAKELAHEPDGLIFQPSAAPYTPGACADVLKWKPSDMNSVDFRVRITTASGPGILPKKIAELYVGGSDRPFASIPATRVLRELDKKIIECTANSNGQWEFMRERTDKVMPNSYDTAVAVCASIRFPVTKEILLHFINNYGYRDKKDHMPPPVNNHHLGHGDGYHHQQQQVHHRQQQPQKQQHHRQQYKQQQQQAQAPQM